MARNIWLQGKRAWMLTGLCLATAMALPAQPFTVLADFCAQVGCIDGRHPSPSLIQGNDGNLYGGAYAGGANQSGTLFKITPTGQLTTLYNFCSLAGCADGENPYGPFLFGLDGNIYGTTWLGGTTNHGVLFKLKPDGKVITAHTFCVQTNCPEGAYPWGSLVEDSHGNIFGTASAGGTHNYGTVFELSSSGQMTAVYSFCALTNCADGGFPYAALILLPGGNLFGTTQAGGPYNNGTVFKLTPSGSLTTLYSFCEQSGCPDGSHPDWLVLGVDGNFYGITESGGPMNGGTFFRLSPAGQFTVLYSFCSQLGCTDGGDPRSLIQATDGNFYGITTIADTKNAGVIFKLTPNGAFTLLHKFCGDGACADGQLPSTGGLFQHTNGSLFGVIGKGGNVSNNGTVFSLSTGFAPFVITSPSSTIVGAKVQILGSSLAGATHVLFNGTPAVFQVVSPFEITTTVPAGATSGPLQVTTPGGTLQSNLRFTVLP